MKRRIAIVLLLLAGGAIVNVAVAWGCALTVQPEVQIGKPESIDSSLILEWITSDGGPLEAVYSGVAPGLSFRRVWSEATDETTGASMVTPDDLRLPIFFSDVFVRSGWPVESAAAAASQRMSLVTRIRYNRRPTVALSPAPEATTISSTGVLIRQPDSIGSETRVLPIYPLWRGFIINTLFYALLLWLLFFVPFTARRMVRRRRGQCETCAYPIGVSPVCTECGAVLAQALRPK